MSRIFKTVGIQVRKNNSFEFNSIKLNILLFSCFSYFNDLK